MSARARFWIVTVAACAAILLTARLGWWQLDRAAQKLALHEAIVSRARMPPLQADQLARQPADAEALFHRRIALQGVWLSTHTVFLDNRQMRQKPGFFVLTPLALPDGTAVLVQRGWLPRDPVERTRVADPPLPTGTVQVEGRIAPPPSRLLELGEGADGAIRQNLDMAAFSTEIARPLRPVSVLQLGEAADGLLRDWPDVELKVAMHHGYAVQWFALSALLAGLYTWFQIVQPRRRAREPRNA